MFLQLLAFAFVVVTVPIWGGALAGLLLVGFELFLKAPILLLLIFLAPFVLNMFI